MNMGRPAHVCLWFVDALYLQHLVVARKVAHEDETAAPLTRVYTCVYSSNPIELSLMFHIALGLMLHIALGLMFPQRSVLVGGGGWT